VPLCESVTATAARFPDRTAVVDGEIRISYLELVDQARRVSGMLKAMGIREGDRVALVLPNSWLYVAAMVGSQLAGAIAVPMNPLLTGEEINRQLRDAAAAAILVHESAALVATSGDYPETLRSVLDAVPVIVRDGPASSSPWALCPPDAGHRCPMPGQTAVILYTSGSTGEPKGVEITHGNLESAAVAHLEPFRLDVDAHDTFLGAVPLAHALGFASVLLPCLWFSGTLVTMRRFDVEVALDLIEQEEISFVVAVPTMLARLVDADHRVSVRVVLAGASALPDSLAAPIRETFGVSVVTGYGMSETTGPISFSGLSEPTPAGSVGKVVEGLQVRAASVDGSTPFSRSLDVGELQIRGSSVSPRYWRRPAATSQTRDDGWFRTGDLGHVDDRGHVYLTGRLKDLIIRGGYNVYPGEVESTLLQHRAVAAAAVVGRDHPTLGQEVHAYVVFESNASASTEELRTFVAARLAPYKVPRRLIVLPDLPTNALGKVVKSLLP